MTTTNIDLEKLKAVSKELADIQEMLGEWREDLAHRDNPKTLNPEDEFPMTVGKVDAITATMLKLAEENERLWQIFNQINRVDRISILEDLCYQGPDAPKNWVKERTAYMNAFNDCWDRTVALVRKILAARKGDGDEKV